MLRPNVLWSHFVAGVVVLFLIVAGVTWQGSRLLDEGEEPRELVVTHLTSVDGPYFTADLDNLPSTEARGKTDIEAVGTLVLANPEEVGVTIRRVRTRSEDESNNTGGNSFSTIHRA